jgi:hypothetical protein
MTIQTIQKYAISKGTTTQNVLNKKKLPLVKLPIFALHNGKYIEIGKQMFIEVE